MGQSSDPKIRNGFLIADDLGKVRVEKPFLHRGLPKLQPLGPPYTFIREPLVLSLELANDKIIVRKAKTTKKLLLISMHFKSKAESYKDITGTQFETVRMEMAAGLLELVQKYKHQLPDTAAVLVLGDRNAGPRSASATILTGERKLRDFSAQGSCKLTRDLEPECASSFNYPLELIALFSQCQAQELKYCNGGSYRYKKQDQLIDDILVPASDLGLYLDNENRPRIGYTGKFYSGSDHRLLWVEIISAQG